MNKLFKLTLIGIAAVSIAACGGKKQTQQQEAAAKEPEKVQVLELKKQRIAKQLELS